MSEPTASSPEEFILPTSVVLSWYRRSKFQAWLMISVLLLGVLPAIPFLLILWTGKVERPRVTNKPLKNPYYRGVDKFAWSIIIFAVIGAHFLTAGM